MRETIISCVDASKLKRVPASHFIEFKKLRKVYERQIEEKRRHLKEDTIPRIYRVSIEDDYLEIFIVAGRGEAPSINELTERRIQQ